MWHGLTVAASSGIPPRVYGRATGGPSRGTVWHEPRFGRRVRAGVVPWVLIVWGCLFTASAVLVAVAGH